jgi:glutathionyl-hydroquinone reductase
MIVVDNFVWLNVTHKAKEVFQSGLFELYELYNDESESLIETMDHLNKALESGSSIVIEVGHLSE